ncbi:MAG: TonB-dependent receptor [Pseudoxanthomonas sp.]
MPTPHRLALAIALALPAISPLARADETVAAPAAEALDLDRLVVHPQLQSQVRAIDIKRDAAAILDVVAADDIGNYPDQNVAESLQRLPGVSVTRDQGEGRYVVIRGLDPAFNSVSVDGIALGTPETDSRTMPLDLIPSESTERLKVVKSVTPDMPGDSIGGAIEVETASAFDRDGRSIRAKLEANHQTLSGKTSPKGSFNYSDLFADNTFGVAFGANYQDRTFQSDNTEGDYELLDNGDPFMTSQSRRKYYVERTRYGANLNLDWHPDEDDRYYFRSLYSHYKDAETRQNTVIEFDADDVVANGDGTYSAPVDDISKRVRWRTKTQETGVVSFGGENRLGAAGIDYEVGYNRTRERVSEIEARFKYKGDDLDATIDETGGLPEITFSSDDWYYNDNYKFNKFVLSPGYTADDVYTAKVNVHFDGEHSSYKMGLYGRWQRRDVDKNETDLSDGPSIDISSWTVAAPSHRRTSLGEVLSSSVLRAYWAAYGSEYSADEDDAGSNAISALSEDYNSREDVLAAYAMGTWDIGALQMIAGVRMENTRFQAEGYQVDASEDGDSFTVTPLQASTSYTNVLPGLHLRWDGGHDWVLRGALNKTVARPSLAQASPHASIDEDDEEVELGNPDLKPYESTNLDLSFEKYIGKAGIVSLGLFRKWIDGYIVDTVTQNSADYDGYDVTVPMNGGDAKVLGAEFNWQQPLDFLPDGWDGLLVGASATWVDTRFDPSLAGRSDHDLVLPRTSKHVYSGFVGYEKYGVSARLSAVYRSDYLDELGTSKLLDIYVAPNTELDFSLEYELTRNVDLYFDASNLLDEPLERYTGSRRYTQQYEEYGRTYAIGVKVKL